MAIREASTYKYVWSMEGFKEDVICSEKLTLLENLHL